MTSPVRRTRVLCSLAILGVLAMGVGVAFSVQQQEGGPADAIMLAELRDYFGVDELTVQSLDLSGELAPGIDVTLSLDGFEETLVLDRHSMRSPDFTVLVQDASGALIETEVGEPRTYRGTVQGRDSSVVAASLDPDGRLSAVIQLDDETEYAVEPLPETIGGGRAGLHVVYPTAGVMPGDWSCGNVETVEDSPIAPPSDAGFEGTGLEITEIAFDADREFYNLNGNSVPNTVNDIERVMNTVELIYERDVSITYEVTFIIVRTSEPDPYSSTDAGGLLGQFQNHWNVNLGIIPRDVAHLMTGKNLNGSTIGIAALSVICIRNSAYGLSQSRFTASISFRAALTAHELGHNWSALHCSGGDCRIMCPGLGGCTGDVTRFGQTSKNSIIGHRNSRSCLKDHPDPITPPFIDTFPSVGIDQTKWTWLRTVASTDDGENEPSPSFSLNLDALNGDDFRDDEIRSNWVELAGNTKAILSYWTEARGPENGETLTIDYWGTNLRWNQLKTLTSDGTIEDFYTFHFHDLPGTARHNRFRVRFRSDCDSFDDEWFVDNVVVAAPDVDVAMSPDSVIVSPGEDLFFDASVTNRTGVSLQNTAWISVFRPDSGPLTTNPRFGPKNFNLQGFQTKEKTNIRLRIPGGAASGQYRAIAFVGNFPDEVQNATEFTFTVQ